MKVYYVTQVFKQSINIKMTWTNYILEFENTNLYKLQVYLGACVKIEIVIKMHAC